jgi:hypothetical protein
MVAVRDAAWAETEAYAAAHPGAAARTLKARLHTPIAATSEPVLFPASPFHFEMGLRPAETWDTPIAS